MNDTTEAPQAALTRVALGIEYDGSSFNGWQIQKSPAVSTVQAALEKALSQVANHSLRLYCAGRTDAGVHATGQVVHFETSSVRATSAWVRGGNALLPPSVSVRWAQEVAQDFHARFSATARRYRYIIHNQPIRPALLNAQLTAHYQPLDAARMNTAARFLLGERDFTSFRGVACQSSTPMRNVMHLRVERHGDLVVMDIKANAFLLHMVRNIAGVLLEIGEGRREPEWAGEVLARRDRSCAGVTASPRGLYLVQVDYPARHGLPHEPPGPHFLRLD